MNDDQPMLDQMALQLQQAQIGQDSARLNMQQMEMQSQEESKGLVTEQLDLGSVLDHMYNLLSGHTLKRSASGNLEWTAPENNDLVVLSEYGIGYIMQMLQAYLTKNTLLSNYDDTQIAAKMEDFSTTLADDIFMEYDKMFLEPTLEECKTEIKRRIAAKGEVRAFALELMNQPANKAEIEKEILKEMEGRILRELEVIKEQKRKNKLKRFESIIRMVQDAVHSAYQRAWKGQERTTLRQHIHVSENKGGMMHVPERSSMNPFGMFRKR